MAPVLGTTWLQRTGAGLLVVAVGVLLSLVGARPAAAQATGVIQGTVLNGTAGAVPPGGIDVVVHVLTNRVKTGEHRVQTDPSGRFQVEGLAVGPETIYLPIVAYGGVSYYPERPITLSDAAPVQTDITVFESTPRPDAVSFDRLNMLVMGVTPTALTIMEMGAVTNGGDRTYAADPQVTGSARTLRFLLPPGAIQVSAQAGLNQDTLESMPDGFATTEPVRPGRREIAFSYQLPYTSSSLDFARSFALPVGTFTLYVPDEVREVVGPGMALQGTADLGGRSYRQYVVQQVTPGTDVRFRLNGLPAPLFARPRDLGLTVVGVSSVILVGFLAYGIWRRRGDLTPLVPHGPLSASERGETGTVLPPLRAGEGGRGGEVSPGGRGMVRLPPAARLALVRAVAQLDERFEAGELAEEQYHAERAAQKAKLVALTRPSTGVT